MKKEEYPITLFLQKLKELNTQKTISVQIVSNSMEPIIKTGEIIHVEKLTGEPKIFDILVFYQNNIFLCHYFWKKNTYIDNDGKNYLTRALASHGADIPFSRDQILGRVVGKHLSFLRQYRIVLRELLF